MIPQDFLHLGLFLLIIAAGFFDAVMEYIVLTNSRGIVIFNCLNTSDIFVYIGYQAPVSDLRFREGRINRHWFKAI